MYLFFFFLVLLAHVIIFCKCYGLRPLSKAHVLSLGSLHLALLEGGGILRRWGLLAGSKTIRGDH
jgi:hypothetical protein